MKINQHNVEHSKKTRELIKKDELDPTKDQSQGRNSLTCSNGNGYSLKGTTDTA